MVFIVVIFGMFWLIRLFRWCIRCVCFFIGRLVYFGNVFFVVVIV